MCQKYLNVILNIVVLFYCQSSTMAESVRSLENNGTCSVTVKLNITPPVGVLSWAVEESPLCGMIPLSISENGIWDAQNRIIKWGVFFDNTARTLTYQIGGWDGTCSLIGKSGFDGILEPVTGVTQTVMNCTPPQVSSVKFNPPSGSLVPVSVTLSCPTAGSEIHYTTDGTLPGNDTPVYVKPLEIASRMVLRSVAYKIGMSTGEVASASYFEPPPAPPAQISRTVTDNAGCAPRMSIKITPVNTVKSWALEEKLPMNLTPSEISDEGVWDSQSRTIRWGVFFDTSERTLTYKVSGPDAAYPVSGLASFDGLSLSENTAQITLGFANKKTAMPVFSPPTGTPKPGSVFITCATPNARIYYTTDGSVPTETSLPYSGSVTVSADVTFKARAFKDGLLASDISQAVYPVNESKAIIVAGGRDTSLWLETKKNANIAYFSLMFLGYSKNAICYLNPEQDDIDGNGIYDDISNDPATSATLKDKIRVWASDAKDLIIFLVDHGGDGTFYFNTNDILYARDMAVWLDELQTKMTGRLIIVYDACQSGSFLNYLKRNDRIIITSSNSKERAVYMDNGIRSFSYQFWMTFFADSNLNNAFINGRKIMQFDQHCLIDANGDGYLNTAKDYEIANTIVIGRGVKTASLPPEIRTVSGNIHLIDETTAGFFAKDIMAMNPLTRVWAVVIPPNFNQIPSGTDIAPVTDQSLPIVVLQDSDKDGAYTGTYSSFTQAGTYKLNIYALDSQGMYSIPKQINVTKGIIGGDIYENDNTPEAARVIMPNSQNTKHHAMPGYAWYQTHNFYDYGDADWVKFYGVKGQDYRITAYVNSTVTGMKGINGQNSNPVIELYNDVTKPPILKAYEGLLGETEVLSFENCPANGIYYVKIRQCDENQSQDEIGCKPVYGDGTEYNLELIQPYQTLPGIIYGTVIPAKNTYVVTSDELGVLVDEYTNEFFLGHPAGDWTLWAKSEEYNTFETAIMVPEAGEVSVNATLPLLDRDGDGTPDISDLCPNDPGKINPGICGCGLPDTDSDRDGTSDCIDKCPNDPSKIEPGKCGCSVPDTDTDGDGTPDCKDNCRYDPNKIEPGICGCGISDSQMGDINRDCKVDLKDAMLALKILVGSEGQALLGYAQVDVNQDGKLGLQDIIYILRKMAGF